jgi:hypothetical protein
MTAEITTSDAFVLTRALNKLEKITSTRYLWAMQHLAYAVQHRTDPPFPLRLGDFKKHRQLVAKVTMFMIAPNAKQLSENVIAELLDQSHEDVVRVPRPGEVEEMIKEIENLFADVTTPPPKRPGGGGRRVRKVT